MPQMMINTWLGKAASEISDQSLVDAMRDQAARTTGDTAMLAQLADQCRAIATPLDSSTVLHLVSQLR